MPACIHDLHPAILIPHQHDVRLQRMEPRLRRGGSLELERRLSSSKLGAQTAGISTFPEVAPGSSEARSSEGQTPGREASGKFSACSRGPGPTPLLHPSPDWQSHLQKLTPTLGEPCTPRLHYTALWIKACHCPALVQLRTFLMASSCDSPGRTLSLVEPSGSSVLLDLFLSVSSALLLCSCSSRHGW